MDQLSEEVRQESPWTMMFADDIVICSESREQVEENLERWRFALERRGMKVSRSKTEYMCANEREGSGTVRLQGEEVKKVQEFKYLGSTVQSNGECAKEVKKRVQAGWNGWRKVSGVLYDRKISARIKGKVYRTVVRPAMLYGLETVSLRKRQESELEVAELKMLRQKEREAKKAVNSLVMQLHKAQLSELACNKQDIMEKKKEEKSMAKQAAVLVAQPVARETQPACTSDATASGHDASHAYSSAKTDATSVAEATHGVRVEKEDLRQVEPGDNMYVKEFKRKHWSQPRREGPFKNNGPTPPESGGMSSRDPVEELAEALRRALAGAAGSAASESASAASAAAAAVSSPPVYASPMAVPAPYSGAAEDCNGFLLQCSLTLEMQAHL
ncbi:hypothetical protein QTP70_010657 [Hemibagrus guttatus]|uniref:ribonuclease H n=1 Tax=Hemibagrus guttatus TaxID=175788 RepID=A0AAE0UMB0_9TELE|nr:hypothetical protein QTP70_010657 [Hemibagrus guttatus]